MRGDRLPCTLAAVGLPAKKYWEHVMGKSEKKVLRQILSEKSWGGWWYQSNLTGTGREGKVRRMDNEEEGAE